MAETEDAHSRMLMQQYSVNSNRDPHRAEFLDRFEMDHLLSLTGLANSPMDPNDGLYRLKQREAQSSISTLRCLVALIVRHNRKEIMVKNLHNGEEMESFPLSLVSTIFFRRSLDPRETYNNKVVIILSQSPRNLDEPIPEMHIFQSLKTPADEVVERINQFKIMKLSPVDYPPLSESEMHVDHQPMQSLISFSAPSANQIHLAGGSGLGVLPIRGSSAMDITNGTSHSAQAKLEREIYLINRCFEDVEKFVAKLQKAVRVYTELKQKLSKSTRGSSKRNKRIFDYTVGMRAQLPTDDEFVECFKLIKLSLNLLARLDPSHTTPNRLDSTHALFNILEVVTNASRDPKTKDVDLARRVVSPLLSTTAVQFLNEILTPQEKALWKVLGESWTTSREAWRGQFVPSYLPVFSDGFTPTLWDYDEEIFASQSAAGIPSSSGR